MRNLIILITSVFFLSSVSAQWSSMTMPMFCGQIRCIEVTGDSLWSGCEKKGFLLSGNGALSWNQMSNGIPPFNGNVVDGKSLVSLNGNLYGATLNGEGIYKSTDHGNSWLPSNNGSLEGATKFVNALEVFDGKIFAASQDSGIFYSADEGNSWQSFSAGLQPAGTPGSWNSRLLVSSNDYLYCIGQNTSVYRTDTSLSTWSDAGATPLPTAGFTTLHSIHAKGNNLAVGGTINFTGGFWQSEGPLWQWDSVNTGISAGVYVEAIEEYNGTMFAGTSYGVFRLASGAQVWENITQNLTDTWITCMAVNDTFLFVGTTAGTIWRIALDQVQHAGEALSQGKVFIFPNPTDGKSQFEIPDKGREEIRVEIRNSSGIQVRGGFFAPGTLSGEIDLQGLPAGLYVIRISMGKNFYTGKVVKQP